MAKPKSKSYSPAETEKRVFDFWQAGGYFHPDPDDRDRDHRFSMVIPPPNVTGALHLGHALNNTLQDILIRQKRMAGNNTFWLLGTDHAGIATQATVEKTIRKDEGKSRHDLGREELVRRIWEWKERFGGRIVEQLKLMGCSCDYERERFTLDDGCAKAVRHTFFKLFRDGLIYRGKRLVNWDTQLQTAVADDEVYHETVKGHFYHFKYPVIDPKPGEPEFVHIATTRPETMLADTAVAVHPDPEKALDRAESELNQKLAGASEKEKPGIQAALEEIAERRTSRLSNLLKLRDMARDGRMIRLPLTDRVIPLICDEWAKPELGSGCVKITPAHDPNDYDVGQRHELPLINVMTDDGKIARIVEPDGNANAHSEDYEGLRFNTKGREKVVADLEAQGLVEKIEDRQIDLGHSDRSKSPIEPFLSDQWFVKMGDLTEEEASRIQTPFLKAYIERSKAEPRPSGSGTSKSDLARYPGLAQLAIDAVKNGEFKFHPPRYEKTYVDWLSEKRDWCISRQLWWGHRIPVGRFSICPAHIRGPSEDHETSRARHWEESQSLLRSALQSAGFGDAIDFVWHSDSLADGKFEWSVCTQDSRFHRWCELASPILKQIGGGSSQVAREAATQDGAFQSEFGQAALAELWKVRAKVEGLSADPDVLDTWFSSALWPHSTLGWPDGDGSVRAAGEDTSQSGRDDNAPPLPHGRGSDQDAESLLDYFYPTSVLSTAREIITLWVARMVITGLYNIGKIPFRDVVIHPVIQDGQGRKMSKTLGNGVDPVDIIDEYGADALRFTLADLATETQDIRMPVQTKKLPDGRSINISPKFEKGRNFCNKLWQAATGFVMSNLDGYDPKPLDPTALPLEDRWILSRMTACQQDLDRALAAYRFSDAVNTLYRFMWDDYCSWYIEMSKPRLAGDDRARLQQVLVFVLDRLLRMLHPIVPFVTESLWELLGESAPRRGLRDITQSDPALVAAMWPAPEVELRDRAVEADMRTLHETIRGIREIRTIVNERRGKEKKPAIRSLPRAYIRADQDCARLLDSRRGFLTLLAGCDLLEIGTDVEKPSGSLGRIDGDVQVYVPVADLVEISALCDDEQAELARHKAALAREEARLSNESFVQRADPEVVEQARGRAAEMSKRIQLLERHLADLANHPSK